MTGFYDRYTAVFDAIKTALVYVAAVPPEGEVPGVPAKVLRALDLLFLGSSLLTEICLRR